MSTKANDTITIAPAHIGAVAQPGQSEVFTVYAAKGAHIVMTVQPVQRAADGQCVLSRSSVGWASVSPASFTIKRSGHRRVHVMLGTHGTAGKHDVAILATSSLGGHGNVNINEAVGAQLLATYPGQTAKGYRPCLHLSAPTAHSSALPLVIAAAAAVIVLGAIAAYLAGWHRRRAERGTQ